MAEIKANAADKTEHVRSEKFVHCYSNSAQLQVSPYDFSFSFGEAERVGEGLTVTYQVQVVMSPQHAKALLGVLAHHVKEYEKQVGGEIKLPTEQARETPANVAAVAPTKTQ